jgi:alpha-galactosidase
LPLPKEATQTLDFAGRWSNERNPQRKEIATGTWVRESREGRSGHNFSIADIALNRRHLFNLEMLGLQVLPGAVTHII